MITGDNKFATQSDIEIPFDFHQYQTLIKYKTELSQLVVNSIHESTKVFLLRGELDRTEMFLKKYQNTL